MEVGLSVSLGISNTGREEQEERESLRAQSECEHSVLLKV